jgi:hypothetical protein
MKRQPKWIIGVSIFLFLGGAFLISTSMRKAEDACKLTRITCNDLVRNGPGGNQFITLTDVHLCSAGNAFQRDMDAPIEMYVPIFSNRLPQEPQPAALDLVLQVLDDRDRDQLLDHANVGELNVELWTPVGQLDPWVLDRLASLYPGIKLAKCRVLSVGLHEPSALHSRSEMVEGVVSVVVPIALQLGIWIWQRTNNNSSTLLPIHT